MLNDLEMAGTWPVFIDAFPDARGTSLHIVLGFSPLFAETLGNNTQQQTARWHRWSVATWECRWAAQAAGWNRTTQATKSSETFYRIHHAMVLSCPMPPWPADSDEERHVNISARNDAVNLRYERSHIPVARSTFVPPGTGSVLCTMVFDEEQAEATLRPWVKYHLALGIDRILLYVEDADPTWASKAVADLQGAGRVAVVPFFFGRISKLRKFHMQSGMENHCLFQARHRAEWLVHADVDEYLDLQGGAGSIKGYLRGLSPQVGAVEVRSQYWYDKPEHQGQDVPFPCYMTCKDPWYFPALTRSKWLARPADIKIVNPHIVQMTGSSQRLQVHPSKLRINHYKECRPSMKNIRKALGRGSHCIHNATCEVDTAFRDRCIRNLKG